MTCRCSGACAGSSEYEQDGHSCVSFVQAAQTCRIGKVSVLPVLECRQLLQQETFRTFVKGSCLLVVRRMASELMNITEQAAEPWVAMGYFCLSTKKATRAVYFAQKVSEGNLFETLVRTESK